MSDVTNNHQPVLFAKDAITGNPKSLVSTDVAGDAALHVYATGGMGKLVTEEFDYIAATYPNTSTEVYTYKSGGSGGNTVATVTVVYSDAVTKQIITSVTKT